MLRLAVGRGLAVGQGMIGKIVSGGQTGVDRAALDVALSLGLPCGGWCPKGRLAEDGPIPDRYPVRTTPSSEYAERTCWNVRDSDGTLVLTWGPATGGTALTLDVAARLGKPCLVIDLKETADPSGVASWADSCSVEVLNVAGPRKSTHRKVYAAAKAFLNAALVQEV